MISEAASALEDCALLLAFELVFVPGAVDRFLLVLWAVELTVGLALKKSNSVTEEEEDACVCVFFRCVIWWFG